MCKSITSCDFLVERNGTSVLVSKSIKSIISPFCPFKIIMGRFCSFQSTISRFCPLLRPFRPFDLECAGHNRFWMFVQIYQFAWRILLLHWANDFVLLQWLFLVETKTTFCTIWFTKRTPASPTYSRKVSTRAPNTSPRKLTEEIEK